MGRTMTGLYLSPDDLVALCQLALFWGGLFLIARAADKGRRR